MRCPAGLDDLDRARAFYGEVLGLPQGRSADTWVDWNLHGHQLVTHVVPGREDADACRDPAGNALEFKAFRDESQVFAV